MSKIIAKNISANYRVGGQSSLAGLMGGKSQVITALRDVSFELSVGDRLAVIGPNGSGKSSLLKVLSGVIPTSSGQLAVEGECLSLLDRYFGLIPNATVFENARCKAFSLGLTNKEAQLFARGAIEAAGLQEKEHLPLGTLSSGMAGRFNLAINSKVVKPITILDEWIGTLDMGQAGASGLLESLNQGAEIVILASHNETLVRNLCNKVLLLADGEVSYFGIDFDRAYAKLNEIQIEATKVSIKRISKSTGRPMIHLLHPSKTARQLSQRLISNIESPAYQLVVEPAGTKLAEIPPGEKVVLFYVNPVEKYTRLFNTRRNKGAPFNFVGWTDAERSVFSEYLSFEELLSCLVSPERKHQFHALKSLQSIQYINAGLEGCFGTIDSVKKRMDDIVLFAAADNSVETIKKLFGFLGIDHAAALAKIEAEQLSYFCRMQSKELLPEHVNALSDMNPNEMFYYRQLMELVASFKLHRAS